MARIGSGQSLTIHQQFDPDAVLLLRCGLDRAPGVAGLDDDASGVVDDASELGASRSDDECIVLAGDSAVVDDGLPTLVLQRGAFVPVSAEQLTRFPNRETRRIVIVAPPDGDRWSYVK